MYEVRFNSKGEELSTVQPQKTSSSGTVLKGGVTKHIPGMVAGMVRM